MSRGSVPMQQRPASGPEAGSPEDAAALFKLVARQTTAGAAAASGAAALARLAERPALWRARDAKGSTLLHWAAAAGDDHLLTITLAQGVAVDARCEDGQTPLMWAVAKKQVATAKALLEAGADPEAKDSRGTTPALLAIQRGGNVAYLLLSTRLSREILLASSDPQGCGATHWAAYAGNLDGLRLLAYLDADLGAVDGAGCTPMHRAIMSPQLTNKLAVVRFLLDQKADAAAVDHKGRDCLQLAQQLEEQPATARALRSLLGDPSMRGPLGDALASPWRWLRERSFCICWWSCVVLCVLQYWTARAESRSSVPLVAAGFECLAPLMAISFVGAAYGDQGTVPARRKGSSFVEEALAVLSARGPYDNDAGLERLCFTTWIRKGLRTKYCPSLGLCVDEFDHFCKFMNAPVGRGNHRLFMVHVGLQFFVLWCHFLSCSCLCSQLYEERFEKDSRWAAAARDVMSERPLLMLAFWVDSAALIFVGYLFCEQALDILQNWTHNERVNKQRYAHFWQGGQLLNPFDKGSLWLNCLDFWWLRRRGERGPARQPQTSVSSSCRRWLRRWSRPHVGQFLDELDHKL